MAGTLAQAEFVYRSGTSPDIYQFTIVQNSQGLLFVRDVQNQYGFLISAYSTIPQSVQEDISDAMSSVETLLALTSAVNGTLTFAGEASQSVTFAEEFADTTYRVHVSSSVFSSFRITSKTTSGFTIEASSEITGTVGYDVLV